MKLNLKIFSIIILIITGLTLSYLIYNINNTKKSLAETLLKRPMESAESNLESFFSPMESTLLAISEQAQLGLLNNPTPQFMNQYFGPILANYAQITSMGLANTEGFEYDVLLHDSFIYNRIVNVKKWGAKEHWSSWKNNFKEGGSVLIDSWKDSLKDDPRDRLWYTGVINSPEHQLYWTKPYIYNTTAEAGMSASVCWTDNKTNKQRILALDLSLSDLTKFTQTIKVSANGKLFILSADGKYLGLPKDSSFNNQASINKAILKHVDSTVILAVNDGYKHWTQTSQPTKSFRFRSEGELWWGKLITFDLTSNNPFLIGVILPESDILSEVDQTKNAMIGGFLIIFILTGIILYLYGQSKKMNLLLFNKSRMIYEQNSVINEKSKALLDSINYAKRIQTAMLPKDQDVKKNLPDSFIIYKPKDIVAGDFYWLEKKKGWLLIAVADCTGHGVPGALVSIVCKNGLSRSVRELNEADPGHILNTTREIVIQEFKKSNDKVVDGMDIALCAIKKNRLKYAGAYNPLWIIRKGENKIEEHKACKQPIGKFDYSNDFKTHDIMLNKGDVFYIFSDGYAGQFGGKDDKKFKTKNFKKLLLSIHKEPMETQKNIIDKTFEEWKKDQTQLDDVCIIGVRL